MAQSGPPDLYPMPVINKIQDKVTTQIPTLNIPNIGHPGVQEQTVNRLGKWDKNPAMGQNEVAGYNLQDRKLQAEHDAVMSTIANTPLHRFSAIPPGSPEPPTNVFALKPGITANNSLIREVRKAFPSK